MTAADAEWDAEWDIQAMAYAAARLRHDWDEVDVTGALIALKNSNWAARLANLALARAIADPDGRPGDLRAAAGTYTTTPASPAVVAAAKAAILDRAPAKTGDPA